MEESGLLRRSEIRISDGLGIIRFIISSFLEEGGKGRREKESWKREKRKRKLEKGEEKKKVGKGRREKESRNIKKLINKKWRQFL
jgi:hypothetical protein